MDEPDYRSDGSKYELDFRVGAHELFSGITSDGGTCRYEGVIYGIVPDQRIVYSYEMYNGQDLGSVSLAAVEIGADGRGTKLTYTLPTSTWRSSSPPRGRGPGTGRLRRGRPRDRCRHAGGDQPGPP
jgi:uncharacterized protein YndB with AHSA1/START domain